jgi:nucleoside-diphosphate-sugar epimerase
MKILMIGGTRFFGYHLAKRLIADGHQLSLFTRGRTPDEFGSRVRRIHGDRRDRRGFLAKLGRENYDVVIDMIAYEAEDSRSAVETFSGRVGQFFHISTGSVYIVTKDFPCPLREEDFDRVVVPRPADDEEWWLYGSGKRGCEEVLRRAYENDGLPITILRLPIVFGERDYTLRAYSYFLRLEDGRPLILPDSGLNVFTHIYQGDVVRTVAANLLNAAAIGQAYNLAQAEIMTLRGFVLAAARIMGREPELVDIPSAVLKASGLGTSFSPLFTRRPFVLVTEKARRDLGFASTPLEAWLEKTIRWFREEYRGGPPENFGLRDQEAEFAARYRQAVESIFRPQGDEAGGVRHPGPEFVGFSDKETAKSR